MPGITPPKDSRQAVQVIIRKGGSVRIVGLVEAKEIHEKNRGVARWLKKVPVHRHEGGHSIIDGEDSTCKNCRHPRTCATCREDGTCENYHGRCKPVKLNVVDITPLVPRARSKWTQGVRRTQQEANAYSEELRLFKEQLPEDESKREFSSDEMELLSRGRILETLSSWDGEQAEEEADEGAVKLQHLLDEQELSVEQALLTRKGTNNTSTPAKTALGYLLTKLKKKKPRA